jgi:hypothetical protein
LTVGHGRDAVQVHKGILRKSSDFYKNALNPEWAGQKVDPHTLVLLDHTLEDADLYTRWLYSNDLIVNSDAFNDEIKADELFRTLINVYTYSEKILDAAYNNPVFKVLVKALTKLSVVPGRQLIKDLYEESSPECLARSLVTSFVAHGIYFTTESGWHKEIQGYPREALVDLVEAMSALRGREATLCTCVEIGQAFLDRIRDGIL